VVVGAAAVVVGTVVVGTVVVVLLEGETA